MLRRVVLVYLLLVCSGARAAPMVTIHATCAAKLAREPVYVQTLRGELTRALDGIRTAGGYALDVSLVELSSTGTGNTLEVRVEVRAMLSDARGRVRYASASRATARGQARDRMLIERDALAAAAHDVARAVRTHAR